MNAAHEVEVGLAADGLTKRYGKRLVVDDVTFTVRPGEIVGFLGPNGAGKSTTMRMLVGLSVPHSGTATVDGVDVRRLPNAARRVGVLLDASATHSGRSVAANLRTVVDTIGAPASRVPELLEAVGLQSVASRRAGALSLGMRQRLGLAIALVGEPRYLVLDEPLNGLDTEGVGWVKDVLMGFARSGGGVLMSTHLMAEVATVADRIVVIDRGRVVGDSTLDAIVRDEGRCVVRSEDDLRLGDVLRRAGITSESRDGGLVCEARAEAVGRIALDARISLAELRPLTHDLAQYVLSSTSGEFAASSTSALLRKGSQ